MPSRGSMLRRLIHAPNPSHGDLQPISPKQLGNRAMLSVESKRSEFAEILPARPMQGASPRQLVDFPHPGYLSSRASGRGTKTAFPVQTNTGPASSICRGNTCTLQSGSNGPRTIHVRRSHHRPAACENVCQSHAFRSKKTWRRQAPPVLSCNTLGHAEFLQTGAKLFGQRRPPARLTAHGERCTASMICLAWPAEERGPWSTHSTQSRPRPGRQAVTANSMHMRQAVAVSRSMRRVKMSVVRPSIASSSRVSRINNNIHLYSQRGD
ncbi:hypothetical protein IWX49DRAFT_24268 [Phyllosticta citricarpa]|uniref:Uncharacterized protein n=2 Tax=Phyllosticta TaxID=121621 RepID=A0ABR1LSX7_9PEZI